MAYPDVLRSVAQQLGIKNDPETGFDESQLTVSELVFYDAEGTEVRRVTATPKNKGGRLFFQKIGEDRDVPDGKDFLVDCDDELRADAAMIFEDYWKPEIDPGPRAILDAIRDVTGTVQVITKK